MHAASDGRRSGRGCDPGRRTVADGRPIDGPPYAYHGTPPEAPGPEDAADLDAEAEVVPVRAACAAALLAGSLAGGGAEGLARLVKPAEGGGLEPTDLGRRAVEAADCLAGELLWQACGLRVAPGEGTP